jgi:hypothetical protein
MMFADNHHNRHSSSNSNEE